jgi:hypothetical protein
MRSLRVTLLAVLLAACASQGGPSAEPSGTPALDLESDGPSLVGGETISGVLSADSIEGGCVFLEGEDGDRYEVLWPEGWRVSGELELIDADGEVVAEGGDRITVRGRPETGMGSICQIGEIFQATEVTVDE